MGSILYILIVILPWSIKRFLLVKFLKYQIHPTSRIGLSWVFPKNLSMGPHSSIGHLNVCKNLSLLQLGNYSRIGRGNWITGYPKIDSQHFAHQTERKPQLIIGEHSAITNRHIIDCTDSVRIGNFSTFAGFHSQIITHSINIQESCQECKPVEIGDYCFIGTNVVILGGSQLPSYSVLGANSLLNKVLKDSHSLYAGSPCKLIRKIPNNYKYFLRTKGFVY